MLDNANPNLRKELRALENQLYVGSVPNYELFQKLDADKDGTITQQDLMGKVSHHKDCTEAVSRIFGEGGTRMNYSTFSQIFGPGMGSESKGAMYPQLRQPVYPRIDIEHSRETMAKSTFREFNPQTFKLVGTT